MLMILKTGKRLPVGNGKKRKKEVTLSIRLTRMCYIGVKREKYSYSGDGF